MRLVLPVFWAIEDLRESGRQLPLAASSHAHGGSDGGNEANFRQTSSLSTA
jgi:hypothetical protein